MSQNLKPPLPSWVAIRHKSSFQNYLENYSSMTVHNNFYSPLSTVSMEIIIMTGFVLEITVTLNFFSKRTLEKIEEKLFFEEMGHLNMTPHDPQHESQ